MCREKNDVASAGEATLQVNGVKTAGPVQIRNNESLDLGDVPDKRFRRSIKVALIDVDAIGADDYLGTVTIRRSPVGLSVQEPTFTESGADDSLFFKVVA